MIFVLFGFLFFVNCGGLMMVMLLFWVFMGLFVGYLFLCMYKMFRGVDWKRNMLRMVFIFFGVVFVIFFVLNVLLWGEKFFGVVLFGIMFVLMFLWFGILVLLVFVGSYFGFK